MKKIYCKNHNRDLNILKENPKKVWQDNPIYTKILKDLFLVVGVLNIGNGCFETKQVIKVSLHVWKWTS